MAATMTAPHHPKVNTEQCSWYIIISWYCSFTNITMGMWYGPTRWTDRRIQTQRDLQLAHHKNLCLIAFVFPLPIKLQEVDNPTRMENGMKYQYHTQSLMTGKPEHIQRSLLLYSTWNALSLIQRTEQNTQTGTDRQRNRQTDTQGSKNWSRSSHIWTT